MDLDPPEISAVCITRMNSPDLHPVPSPFTNLASPSSSAPLVPLGEIGGSEVRSIYRTMSLIVKIISLMLGCSCIVCNIGSSED